MRGFRDRGWPLARVAQLADDLAGERFERRFGARENRDAVEDVGVALEARRRRAAPKPMRSSVPMLSLQTFVDAREPAAQVARQPEPPWSTSGTSVSAAMAASRASSISATAERCKWTFSDRDRHGIDPGFSGKKRVAFGRVCPRRRPSPSGVADKPDLALRRRPQPPGRDARCARSGRCCPRAAGASRRTSPR